MSIVRTIKRYALDEYYGSLLVKEADNGEYVLYKDHAAEIEKLRSIWKSVERDEE